MTEMWHKGNRSLCTVLCIILLWHVCSCQSDGQSEMNHVCRRHGFRVQKEDLLACENDKHVCVRDLGDCDRLPVPNPVPVSLNISCYFDPVDPFTLSCSWCHESGNSVDSTYSLIFSQASPVDSCPGLLNPNGLFNITLKQRVSRQEERWLGPHLVDIWEAVKAPVPSITSVNSTEDSLTIVWIASTEHNRCQVRSRPLMDPGVWSATDHTWTQTPGHVSVKSRETVVYVINGLQPYTSYLVSVACVGSTGHWSEWSTEITGITLEKTPTKGPEVCFHIWPKTFSGGPHSLTLMWKALDVQEAGGRVLGYRVSYTPMKKTVGRFQNVTIDTTGLRTELAVWEEQGEVTVTAYNMAGCSPPSHLSIYAVPQEAVPSVRSLWVSSRGDSLLVQWDMGASSLPVSEFAMDWTSHTRPASRHWRRVDGHIRSAVLAEHVQLLQTYDVRVYPIYLNLCGPPQSLTASLEHGALLKPVQLHAVVTKTMVTVGWVWKQERLHRGVGRYRLVLRQGRKEQAVSVWPDVRQHTFPNLSAHTEYSVHLLADDDTTEIVLFTTDAFYYTETIATVTLLALCLGLLAVLSRTLCKKCFSPHVADPQVSRIGQWLLKPHCEEAVKKCILKLEDFLVTDLLEERSLTVLDLEPRSPTEEDLTVLDLEPYSEEDSSSSYTTLSCMPLTRTHTQLSQANHCAGTLQQTTEYVPIPVKTTVGECIAPSLLNPSAGYRVTCPPQTEPRVPPENPVVRPEHPQMECILEYIKAPGLVNYTVSSGTTIECEVDYIQNTFCQPLIASQNSGRGPIWVESNYI